jgi:predicted solute-binding protein
VPAKVLDEHRQRLLDWQSKEKQTLASLENLPASLLERYFSTLRYGFGPRELDGLNAFADGAVRVGDLQSVPRLAWTAPGAVATAA